MKNGSIVKAVFQQSDGKVKYRPALILGVVPPFEDILICAIGTQLWVEELDAFVNIRFDTNHPDFDNSGLTDASVIRLGYLATLPKHQIEGVLGEISQPFYAELIERLIQYFERVK